MAQQTVIRRFSPQELLPAYDPDNSNRRPFNVAPNLDIPIGRLMGKITNSANHVMTLTVTGTPTGGSLTYTFTHPLSGATGNVVIPYNAATAAAQTLLQAFFGANNVAVAGAGALPGNAHTWTFQGALAGMPIDPPTLLTNGLTGGTAPAGAVAQTTTGRTANTLALYADANSNGTETAIAIAPWAMKTDAKGRITLSGGAAGAGDQWGTQHEQIDFYVQGFFRSQELSGLDAAAVAQNNLSLVEGSITAGVVRLN